MGTVRQCQPHIISMCITYVILTNTSRYTFHMHSNSMFDFHGLPKDDKGQAEGAKRRTFKMLSLLSTTLHGPGQPKNLQPLT